MISFIDTAWPKGSMSRALEGLGVGFLFLLAVARMAATYGVYCQTYDEPPKLSRGMEWWLGDRYRYVDHPPLAGIFFAIGPMIMGANFTSSGDPIQDGNAVLHEGDRYGAMLTAARLGNLVFFLAAMLLVWLWCRQLAGPRAGILAVLLFSTLPIILGHSAIVSTDMVVTAAVGWVMLIYQRWLNQPSFGSALVLGSVVGLALLSKFSACLFILVGIIGVTLTKWAFQKSGSRPQQSFSIRASQLAVSLVVALWAVWAGYQFSFGRVSDASYIYAERAIEKTVARAGNSGPLLMSLMRVSVPAPEFAQGLVMIIEKEHAGHANYFLGQRRNAEGSWLFFPMMLATKTPLPFLVLTTIGAVALIRRSICTGKWHYTVPVVVPAALLASVLPSDINIGVRHVLPVYPFLAIVAASGSVALWTTAHLQPLSRSLVLVLVATHAASGFVAHPDYLPYYNWLAGDAPEAIAVDSDLDWGQDLPRLAEECKRRSISTLHLAYFGTADVARHGLPNVQELRPFERANGWIAISLTTLKTKDGYSWLEDLDPVTLVGRSIRLYYHREGTNAVDHHTGIKRIATAASLPERN